MTKIRRTADTITDDQICALRAARPWNTWWLREFAIALGEITTVNEPVRDRHEARARCAVLLNDRNGSDVVKTLPEVVRDAIQLLAKVNESERDEIAVVIARGDHEPLNGRSQAFQIWIFHDVTVNEYRCETRSWLGTQWSALHERRGWLGGGAFDIADVLATDWRIIS